MRTKTLKSIFSILTMVFIFVNIFLLNVVLHEIGHYVAADYYKLEPKIEFNFEKIGEIFNFSFNGVAIASTSFIDERDNLEIFVVSLMGPFINLILGLIFLMCFIFFRNNKYIGEIALIGFVVSFGSFVMNILPFNGSDGSLIFGLF